PPGPLRAPSAATSRPPKGRGEAREEASQAREATGDAGAVRVEPGATVRALGEALGVPPTRIIQILLGLGEMKTVTQTLSTEEIELVAEELGRR
ncbi:translation initiation factor IF-2, partial [Staphylococcus aureus]